VKALCARAIPGQSAIQAVANAATAVHRNTITCTSISPDVASAVEGPAIRWVHSTLATSTPPAVSTVHTIHSEGKPPDRVHIRTRVMAPSLPLNTNYQRRQQRRTSDPYTEPGVYERSRVRVRAAPCGDEAAFIVRRWRVLTSTPAGASRTVGMLVRVTPGVWTEPHRQLRS
jgi:hypothetical protein